ncbi:MAG: hypothetical protein LAP85_10065 [Acidobacteriia bacterium]|nr:hypothetical protein [Terriglobia bacterium]
MPECGTTGIVSAVFRYSSIVIAIMLMASVPAGAQLSPGVLSQAHSSLDGAAHCIDCHEIGQRSLVFKCLDCHREIRQRLDEGRGLHSTLVGQERSGLACIKCHSEHNGRNFGVIHWDPPQRNFDHRKTGYILAERHAALPCRDCHQSSHIPAQAASDILVKDRSRTLLGLSRECTSCHLDQHHGQLSAKCNTCHNFSRWRDALSFDHQKSRFPLEGPHEKVECQKCHQQVADVKPYLKYQGLVFEDCTPCHSDPHRGAFQATCKTCHSQPSWKPVVVSSVFDHARTKYPLQGKHAALPCKSCHKKSDFKQPVAHDRCADCHRPSPHKDQFANRADGGECSACHRVEGFKPSTFNAAQHRKSRYPLDGRHAAVRCDQCHKPQAAATVYRITDTRCAACHTDTHAGQFYQPPYAGQCESCHTVKAFSPSTFALARHQSTRFPLTNAHGAVVCSECHRKAQGKDALPAKYHFENRACSACHADIHRGQFSERMAQPGPDGAAGDCATCHSTATWQKLPDFNHSKTDYALVGAHERVPCDRCHQRGEPKPDIDRVIFKATPRQCAACHEDRHGGQFAAEGSTECSRCHTPRAWKPSTFNHDTGSSYALKGAHSSTPCAGCHTATTSADGKKVISYRGLPHACSACHRSKEPTNARDSEAGPRRQGESGSEMPSGAATVLRGAGVATPPVVRGFERGAEGRNPLHALLAFDYPSGKHGVLTTRMGAAQ